MTNQSSVFRFPLSVFRFLVLCGVLVLCLLTAGFAAERGKPIRVGLIGLDTSHVIAFTQIINDPKNTGDLADLKVVAAYPGGSPDLPDSWDRVKGYTEDLRKKGVEIVPSIDDLLKKVDAVMIESLDGRPHLAQARPVIAARKPLFIDKPMAASLADVIQIFRLAKEANVPCFSASSLRFSAGFQAARHGKFGDVKTCVAWSPMSIEPHHPDLFWYGVHGVETLFTIMGPGCKTVTRVGRDKVVGQWAGGREGTFEARKDYGAEVVGTKSSGTAGKYDGYKPLIVEVAKFFKTVKSPVAAEETIELFAFMEAADESKRQGGAPVSIESVLQKARRAAAKP
jgi:predicted dehydrogenase